MTNNNTKTVIILALVAAVVVCFYGWVWGSRAELNNNNEAIELTSGESFKWRLVTTWPKNLPGLGAGPENFAKLINEISNGRLTVEVFGAGELVPALQVFDAVSSGAVQMGHGAAYYWKGKAPAAVFFTAVPFGLNAQEFNGWLSHGEGLALWRKTYKPFGLVPYPGGNTGVQMGGWFNKRIDTLADMQGLKMRIPGLAGEVFTRAGGTAVSVPGGELYTSLQTGVIDATEWVGPYNDVSFGFDKIAKYYYYPGWHEPGAGLEFIVNEQALAQLPTDLQAMVQVATQAISADMLNEYAAGNSRSYTRLKENKDIEILRYPDEVLIKLKQITEKILQEEAAKDELFAEVYASYKAFQNSAEPYTKISEQAYGETRELKIAP